MLRLLGLLMGLSLPHITLAGCDPGALCGPGACTISGTHQIDAGCVLDFDAAGVTALTLDGGLEAAEGDSFTLKAATLDGAGTLEAPGGRVTVQTTGNVAFAGSIDVSPGGAVVVYGGGPVVLTGEVVADGTTAPDAGSIEISGTAVEIHGAVRANGGTNGRGGRVSIAARAGSVTATADSLLGTSGGGTAGDAGTVEIDAGTALTVDGSVLSDGTGTGDGGTVRLVAGGVFTTGGTINARATGTPAQADGGDITLLATAATITGTLRAGGLGSGDGGTIRLTLTAADFALASSGRIDVGSGAEGHAGSVTIVAPGDVLLAGPMTANASGATSEGGSITARAGDVLTVTAAVEARSTTGGGTQEGALVELAGCTLDIRAPIQTRSGAGSGQARFYYTDAMTVVDTSLLADDAGAVVIGCACSDADADGTCEAPLACRTDPVLTNVSATPDPKLYPEYPTVCG